MAGKRKIIKKKLKEPDELISFTEHALRLISRHYRRIIAGGAVLGVLLLAYFLFEKWEEKKEGEAYQLFAAVLERYQVIESPYREEGASADYKNLVEKFDEVITKFPRTSSGKLSLLHKANLHLKLSEFEEAIKTYEAFLQRAGKERLYRLFALEGLGYAYEGKKEYEKAIAAYEKMLEIGGGPQIANAHLSKGRCYEKLGKKKEALESYKAFLEVAPKSMMANFASGKISYLEQ
ncbi:MAG: tetratricopeptide repeat protein [Thermodesulfobacteriota bacterium]